MSSILLTGGSGLLALNWARAVEESWTVHLALHERASAHPRAHFHFIDLASSEQLDKVLAEISPDLVVHAAGMTNIEACEADPLAARRVNVGLADSVSRACARGGVKLVHVSTDHLFDGTRMLVDENEPVSPLNVYARTKADAELAALANYPSTLVVRTNFYGWGTSYRRSFSDMIISALRERRTITLFDDVFFTPILMDVLVGQVHRLVQLDAQGIFNVVGDRRLSKYAFGCAIADRFGLDAACLVAGSILDAAGLTRRPRDMSLSSRKAHAMLGSAWGDLGSQLDQLVALEQAPGVKELQKL
jgi:dTDP-4-dehydrorhamnose reductase